MRKDFCNLVLAFVSFALIKRFGFKNKMPITNCLFNICIYQMNRCLTAAPFPSRSQFLKHTEKKSRQQIVKLKSTF